MKGTRLGTFNYHDYTYSLAGQRTLQSRAGAAWQGYDYDPSGQLVDAHGEDEDGTRAHENFRYVYDAAGNLTYKTNHTLVQNFGVNSLNQVTNLSRTGNVVVAGTYTGSPTSVEVNGNEVLLVYSDGTFASDVNLNGAANTIQAVAYHDAITAQHSISVQLATNSNFTYDTNGNMLSDGQRSFVWDDENQLTELTITGATRSHFTYDGKMRRRSRTEAVWQNGLWHTNLMVHYVYDGNVVLQERHYYPNISPTRLQKTVTYTRGSDLSGSLQGAGGIGGLLARSQWLAWGPNVSTALYHSDGNGNVTLLLGTNQQVLARYTYEPFGTLITHSGPLAEENLYRFSSKEAHEPSGLVYYLYRYYDPSLQRWPNRDPIGEAGFETLRRSGSNVIGDSANLYLFVRNNPISHFDPDGRKSKSIIAIILGWFTGCRKMPAPPQAPWPANDPCFSKANIKAALTRWSNCQSETGDGNGECLDIAECIAQGNELVKRSLWSRCSTIYKKNCP